MRDLFKRTFPKIYYSLADTIVSYRIHKKYSSQIRKLKDIHKGKRCFIIGNGPSLQAGDLDRLKDEFTFAANKICLMFEKTAWRPTYYCVMDAKVIETEGDVLKNIEAKIKFIHGFMITKNIIWDKWVYLYIKGKDFYPNEPKFSDDISKKVYEGYTVTYNEIQIAAYMGFTEIYLLGIDHSYSRMVDHSGNIIENNTPDYFSTTYMGDKQWGKDAYIYNIDNSTLAYKAARRYAEKNGIKIMNATRGGCLEIFERVDFDSLFQ